MDNFKKASKSSLLLVLEQLVLKSVGLFSTIILARFILPEDFGIIAIALLVVGFIEILSETGSAQYLMRTDKINDEQINTAWSINLVLKFFVSLLMVLGAFIAADFYEDERLVYVIISLSLISFLSAFNNPGLAYLTRNQEYSKIIKISLITKIFAVITTIISALILQNYWAIILGKAASAISMLFCSNLIYDYKRKFQFKNSSEQWNFSIWVIPQAIFGYVRTQLDTFLVSTAFGQTGVGSYYTIKYLSYIPSENFLTPISKPFLVELANVKHDNHIFTRQFNVTFILMMTLCLPIVGLMYCFHDLFTLVVLGKNWVNYSFLLQIFAFLLPSYVMVQHATRVLLVYGETKKLFIFQLLSFIAVYIPIITLAYSNLNTFSILRVVLELLSTSVFFLFIGYKYTGLNNIFKLCISFLLPFLSFALSLFFSKQIIIKEVNPFFDLLLNSMLYLLMYIFCYLALFFIIFKNIKDIQYLKQLATRFIKW